MKPISRILSLILSYVALAITLPIVILATLLMFSYIGVYVSGIFDLIPYVIGLWIIIFFIINTIVKLTNAKKKQCNNCNKFFFYSIKYPYSKKCPYCHD